MKRKLNKAIIFDFDGVILNSHLVKTNAFYKVFLNYGKQIATKAKRLHLKNAGVARIIKFKLILKTIVKTSITKKKILDLQNKFSVYSKKKIEKLNINKYLLNFLSKNHKKYNLYISTGTSQKEILKIVKEKKISKYFIKVLGSPRKKVDHIKMIKKSNHKIIFIGDSKEDYISSLNEKVFFIAKINAESRNYFKNKNVPKIYGYKNIKKVLGNCFKL